LTAENVVERLSSKTKRSAYVAKTEAEYERIVGKYSDAVSAKGKLTRELDSKQEENAMVKVILFKDKDQPGGNDDDVPVNVEFAPGTSVAQARKTKGELRKDAKN